MSHFFRKCPSGFTFVESLITFSIVGIFLALTWATVQFLIVKSGEQVVRTRAHFLAVEGMERVKQIEKTAINKDRETGFRNTIGDNNGDYVLQENAGVFSLKPGSNEVIETQEEPYAVYCRTVHMEEGDGTFKEVSVEVRWGGKDSCADGDKVVAYSTYLADLTP